MSYHAHAHAHLGSAAHPQYRAQMHKRLTTTVEEDATARDNFAALAERRERAAGEKLTLEHKLRLQRLEMAKALGTLQVSRQN